MKSVLPAYGDVTDAIERQVRQSEDFAEAQRRLRGFTFPKKVTRNLRGSIRSGLSGSFGWGIEQVEAQAGGKKVDLKPAKWALQDIVDVSFNLQFDTAEKFFENYALKVAHVEEQALLDLMLERLTKALGDGTVFVDFQDGLEEIFTAHGVTPLNPSHVQMIFNQNLNTAYEAGHYMQARRPELAEAFPLWQYQTMGDMEVRPTHQAMDGYTASRDDPIWDSWWPPCGFGCRCNVDMLHQVEIEEEHITPSGSPPKMPGTGKVPMPDLGFAQNPVKLMEDWLKTG